MAKICECAVLVFAVDHSASLLSYHACLPCSLARSLAHTLHTMYAYARLLYSHIARARAAVVQNPTSGC